MIRVTNVRSLLNVTIIKPPLMLLAIDSFDLSTQWQMFEEEGHTRIKQIEEISLRLLIV